MDLAYEAPEVEYREIYGVGFAQKRNNVLITKELLMSNNIVTQKKEITEAQWRDLVVATITVKYTQSNSVGYAVNGMMIGVGAGQQSRVDCCKLAGRKAETWWARMHPLVRSAKFKDGIKRQERINARVALIEDDFFTDAERDTFAQQFEGGNAPRLTAAARAEWLKTLTGVSCSSDAFFPFRDSIDQVARRGVSCVVQAGGSVADEAVIKAADEHGMVMVFSGLRLFHH